MKNNLKSFIIINIIIVSIIFSSCNPDSLNPIVTIKLPTSVEALVPNAYLQNLIPVSMVVGKTQEVLKANPNYYISNATIELYENGVLKSGWVKGVSSDSNYYYLPNFYPTPGNVYTTKISVPNYPTAEAIDTMPQKVNFTVTKTGNIKYYEDKNNYNSGNYFKDTLAEIKIVFTDNASQNDYYRIVISDSIFTGKYISNYTNGMQNYNKRDIHCIDPIFQDTGDPIGGVLGNGNSSADIVYPNDTYFTDYTFNGKQKELLLYLPIGLDNNNQFDRGYGKAYFFIQHLSRAAYLHLTNVANYDPSATIFSQPTLIYTNYKNGFGILGCNTTTLDSLQVR